LTLNQKGMKDSFESFIPFNNREPD